MQDDQPTDWTEPGAFRVATGVHRIPLPLPRDGLRAVNVYAIETDSGLTLVDGGWAIEPARRQLEQALRRIGYRPDDITSILVTHAHRDHYTQAVTLRAEFRGIALTLGVGARPVLDFLQEGRRDDAHPTVVRLARAGALDLGRQWLAAGGPPDPAIWQPPDHWLDADREFAVGDRRLRAIATPGHTQGHFVFVDEAAGLLFAGDHVLPTITPSIGFEPVLVDDPLGDYLRSLLRVRDLPDLRVLPAHGAPDRRSHERVDELLAHHDHRLALARAAVDPAGSTALHVARLLPWTKRDRAYAELSIFDAALAVLETAAHLDLLVRRSQLATSSTADPTVYYPPPITQRPGTAPI